MAAQPLRPYQAELLEGIRESIRGGHRKILAQLPTGGGKTRVASEVFTGARSKGKRCLFLAPRRELITQTRDSFASHGLHAGIIMAGERASPTLDIQVASFDTLHARAFRTKKLAMPPADIVIIDEAHLSLAQSRADIINFYQDAIRIGLTATPCGPNGRGMGEMYDDLVLGWPMSRLVAEGYMAPARYIVPSEWDLARLKMGTDGDYTESSMELAVDQPQMVGDIVETWLKHASDRRTVVFCVSRKHARHVHECFTNAGVAAEYVDGETPKEERKEIFANVRSGVTRVLVNVFVASYGLDIPVLDCAVLARPTKSLSYHLQTLGRIVRPVYDTSMPLNTIEERIAAFLKPDALVIDHVGNIAENGYIDDEVPWSLNAEVKIKAAKLSLQQEKKEPKPITCPVCRASFSGRRTCPMCGHAAIQPGEPVPIFEGELEVEDPEKRKRKDNKDWTWEQKAAFYGGLKDHARTHDYKHGWENHVYKAKFGVWPNDPRVRSAPVVPVTREILNYIRHRNIKHAKSKARA